MKARRAYSTSAQIVVARENGAATEATAIPLGNRLSWVPRR